ncbi:MAG: hypothetical protein EOS73_10750 [Mesorhizobium sp.]|nr:hypothetical protein EN749_21280 [Mesorhizobium sp. M7A.F.Ca.ET.027.02.1.1]RWD09408.1 MAG: hypothetical protein EOS73_10750 [Mesorhizobium sp.]
MKKRAGKRAGSWTLTCFASQAQRIRPYCPTALLPYCPTALLPYCLIPHQSPPAMPPYAPPPRPRLRARWRGSG